jgi:hypothetical protein
MQAPDLLPIECANILCKKTVLGDLTLAEAAVALRELQSAAASLAPSSHLLDAAVAFRGNSVTRSTTASVLP